MQAYLHEETDLFAEHRLDQALSSDGAFSYAASTSVFSKCFGSSSGTLLAFPKDNPSRSGQSRLADQECNQTVVQHLLHCNVRMTQ
jgi:hypothetical protein